MFHRIHIGYFDVEMIRNRKIVIQKNLPMDLIQPIIDKYVVTSEDGTTTITGELIEISQSSINCPWISIGINVNAVKFVIEIRDKLPDCTLVEFRCGELISIEELKESLLPIEE